MIFKRIFDISFSIFLIIILSPVLILISLLIKLDSRRPIIFKQKRLGEKGREFTIYKFRTMVENAEEKGSGVFTLEDDPRVTRVGSILRKTSLDELPQLFNILKGDMSFVGPRPPVTYHPWEYEGYSDWQKKRFAVKPGVTGVAQLQGRKELPWEERIEYDVYYVDNWSFWLDIKLILLTVPKVLKMENNYNVEEQVEKHSEEKNK